MTKLTHTVHLARCELDALRNLATHFGLLYRTGPFAHQFGNPKLLCDALAHSYLHDPKTTIDHLRVLITPADAANNQPVPTTEVPALTVDVILTPDPELGGYAIHVPGMPEWFSQGETVAEARYNLVSAIQTMLDYHAAEAHSTEVSTIQIPVTLS